MDRTALVNASTLQSPPSCVFSSSLVSSLAAKRASFWASCFAEDVRRRRCLFGVLPTESGDDGSRVDEPFWGLMFSLVPVWLGSFLKSVHFKSSYLFYLFAGTCSSLLPAARLASRGQSGNPAAPPIPFCHRPLVLPLGPTPPQVLPAIRLVS